MCFLSAAFRNLCTAFEYAQQPNYLIPPRGNTTRIYSMNIVTTTQGLGELGFG